MTPGIALVTGAGARLGRAMAVALGEDGWKVAVHYHSSPEGADETCDLIRKAGGTAEAIEADLADEKARSSLIPGVADLLGGPVSLLVNSASTFHDDTALTHSREGWDAHMEPNLRAPIHLAQLMASDLPEGEHGLVINMIDQRVWKLNPVFFTYTLSKAALWQATQTLAQALAPNVRVNGIGPGPTLASVHQTPEEFAAEKAATLTGEGSSPEEIVRAMRYLIAASSVTGQMIASDGGQHLMWQTPDMNL
ncbi:SDR family oxidoreductase [Hyphomonas sp.]|uniref:SDR family oxidoreductase n=1 Tax=Hyphomonas sp. TaxID=87 RepID=UPI000C3A9F85|nr:SDR family oxidoreductase [Hyphomonas sp.]MAB11911.1 short chain dehydrogenase [Hyphomonas sp.]MAU67707.1 short chain dehydrogenase [Hyphomonas sp.]